MKVAWPLTFKESNLMLSGLAFELCILNARTKTINPTVYLAIIKQYIMTAKQQHKDYSCLILKDLRPSESVSL